MARFLPSKHKLLPAPTRPASEILSDYEQWLLANYGSIGTYSDHAKSFLRRFRAKGSLLSLEIPRKLTTVFRGKLTTKS